MFRLHSLLLLPLIATSALAQAPAVAPEKAQPTSLSAAPPRAPAGLETFDFPALLKSFAETFKTDFQTNGYSFAAANTQNVLLIHAQILHDGFFVIHYDFDAPKPFAPTEIIKNNADFLFFTGKKGDHLALGSDEFPRPILANVGDTLLIPIFISPLNAHYNFATTDARNMAKIAHDIQQKDMADAATRPDPFTTMPFIENHAAPELLLHGAALSTITSAMAGRAAVSCTLQLQAQKPGDFLLTASQKTAADPDPNLTFQPLHITILPADQPITVLPTSNFYNVGPQIRLRPNPEIPNPYTLRVGDTLTLEAWQKTINYDQTKPPPETLPSPFTLEKSAPPAPPSDH